MRSLYLSLAIIGAMFCSNKEALAADGSSGCGPAWYVLKDNSLVSSALRGTTNGILSIVVVVGMTFGTSNCSKHSIVKRDMEVERFLTHNYSSFQHDSAKGSGEYLGAVSKMYNCNFMGIDRFNKTVQNSFGYLYDNEGSAREVAEKLGRVVDFDTDLKANCSVI